MTLWSVTCRDRIDSFIVLMMPLWAIDSRFERLYLNSDSLLSCVFTEIFYLSLWDNKSGTTPLGAVLDGRKKTENMI